jgi:isoquinoline 1-oxidoreductase beta subunit
MAIVKSKINRRSFVKISAATGGGLVLGFSWLTSCKNPEMEEILPELEMPQGWVEMNGYIKIGENGVVTIMSPNPEIGQNVKTSMPMIIADELDVDWKNVVVEQAPLDTEKYSRQVAGGSQSIRFGWNSLRTAGATGKAMLVAAAAARWNVDASTLTTSNGTITNANGETLTYGELATEAAGMEVPTDVTLKEVKDFTIIGNGKKNVDLKKIITGQPLFGIDTRVEGMVYASVLRPPAFGQKLDSYDDAASKAVNGVSDVIQFGNKVAVIADSNWAAMKGKKALTANWSEDTPLESTAFHDAEMNKILAGSNTTIRREDGDVEKAFAEADQVLEKIYEAPFLPHNCMEPMNFFAHVTDEKVECLGPIQTPQGTAGRIANLLERDVEDVNIMMSRMGGGFGRRLYGDFALEVAEISDKIRKPVQLVFTRDDDMAAGTYRPASKYKIQASVKNGKVTGYKLTEAAINSNMYGLIPNFFPAGAIENYKVETGNLKSNITTGAWRAPYTNFLGFAEQSFFDELAALVNVDPVQLRLDLLENAKANQEDERMQWSPGRMEGVIKLAAEKSNWGKAAEGVYQGFSAYYSHNTHVAEVAEVVMKDGNPVVTRVVCAVDCGIVINPLGAINQIEGGIIDGIGHAMYGDLVFNDGVPSASNFDKFRLIRQGETPDIEVYFVENDLDPTGLGEPSLPPAGGAVANAIHAATGKRFYKQPFIKQEDILG